MSLDAPSPAQMRAVRAALDDAEETIAHWRRKRTDDEGMPVALRLADLAETIEELREVRRPLSAYCARLNHTNYRSDLVYRVNAEVTTMIDRLRSMQSPRSGTPTPPSPTRGKRSLDKTLKNARNELDAIDAEFPAMRRALSMGSMTTMPSGGKIVTVAELNAEASALLDRIDEARYRVRTGWNAYQRGHEQRVKDATESLTGNPYKITDERDNFEAAVREFRARAKSLYAEVDVAAKQRDPTPAVVRRPYDRWTRDDAIAAWKTFHEVHGRWPKKSDHTRANGLPDYKQLRKIVGSKPFPKMVDLVTTVT